MLIIAKEFVSQLYYINFVHQKLMRMMSEFEESQSISNPIFRFILVLVMVCSLGILFVLYMTNFWSEMSRDDRIGFQVMAYTFLPISLLFLFSKLETRINEEGIHARFLPILCRWRKYTWSEIKKVSTRDCNPLIEYGGWGYRIGIMGQGHAMILSGRKGIQIELKNGKKMLIGTKRDEDAQKIIDHYTSIVKPHPRKL